MGIDDDTVAAYRRLAKAGELPLRVSAYLEGDAAHPEGLAERELEPDDGDDYFALVGVKYFADGALGSRGAALAADYSDDPGNRGLYVTAPEVLDRAVGIAARSGWQVATPTRSATPASAPRSTPTSTRSRPRPGKTCGCASSTRR
jgi:hypothetical protein